jgi:hypothetical protein
MVNQNYYQSYLKYKKKYLELKKLSIGGNPLETYDECLAHYNKVRMEIDQAYPREGDTSLEDAEKKYFSTKSPEERSNYKKCEQKLIEFARQKPKEKKMPTQQEKEAKERAIKERRCRKAYVCEDEADNYSVHFNQPAP